MTTPDFADNPLYALSDLPAFDRITPEHAEPALRAHLTEAEAAVKRLEESAPPTGQGLMDPLYRACHPLHNAWTIVGHFMAVMNSDVWRQAHEVMQSAMVSFSLRVAQRTRLYQGYLALREADRATPCLTGPQRRVLTSAIRDAEQAGIGLSGQVRQRFNAIQQELVSLYMPKLVTTSFPAFPSTSICSASSLNSLGYCRRRVPFRRICFLPLIDPPGPPP